MTTLVLNPGRKRRRRRSSKRHSSNKRWTKAARRAFARKMKAARLRKHGRKTRKHSRRSGKGLWGRVKGLFHRKKRSRRAANGRRGRRSRRRNPVIPVGMVSASLNRRRSRRSRRSSFRLRRRLSSNPAVAMGRGIVGKVTSGFKTSTLLQQAAPMAGGAFLNMFLGPKIAGMLPGGWNSGWKKTVVMLGSAGVVGAAVGSVAPRFAPQALAGAVAQTLLEATTWIMPTVMGAKPAAPAAAPAAVKPAAAKGKKVAGFSEANAPVWAPEMEGGNIGGFEFFGAEDFGEETFE